LQGQAADAPLLRSRKPAARRALLRRPAVRKPDRSARIKVRE
jgi:hypothetical protein